MSSGSRVHVRVIIDTWLLPGADARQWQGWIEDCISDWPNYSHVVESVETRLERVVEPLPEPPGDE